MKRPPKKLFFVIASAALLFAGCSKKPTRPSPDATLVGPGGMTQGNHGFNTSPIATNPDAPLLTPRDDFDPITGQNRAALAANTVYFDYDESAIKASEREKLKNAKEYIDKNPGMRLLLEGHCDWRGTAEYNLGLGDRRANAVKKYLLSLGLAADKLETLSKGSLNAKPNADAATMEKDRRVDLIVSKAAK
jgi:peptidoglycan-associated lipoprotein